MNVLMLVSWYTPYGKQLSAGVFHYEQSMALKKYCDVSLYHPFDEEMRSDYTKHVENGLTVYRSKYKKGGRISSTFKVLKAFRKIKKEYDVDIIHAHVAYPGGFIAMILSKLYRIPYIITEHTPIEMAGLDSFIMRKFVGLAYRHSCANICVSKNSMRRLSKIFPKEQFQVIYNGTMNPDTVDDNGVVYRKEGYINCCIVAGFYDKEIKGYQYLLPAIKKIKDDGYKICLHICGGGTYFDYYKNMAKDLDIDSDCIFYGNVDRQTVYSIVKQMDFNISSSIFECSGVSVQEAMLLGKPLVVTKSGGANSLVTSKTAIVVDRKSVDALVKGIKHMCETFMEYDEDEIKKYAYYNFEIDNVSKKYIQEYSRILNRKK